MKGLRASEEWLATHLQKGRIAPRSAPSPVALPTPQPNKYKAVKTGKYASGKEAAKAAELKLLEQSGAIRELKEQVRFDLIPAQYIDGKCVERAVTWTADFVYEEIGAGGLWCTRVVDAKGVRTQQYVLRRKLMLHVHGIRVIEV